MKNLHAMRPIIHENLIWASATLLRDNGPDYVRGFRLTGAEYTPGSMDYNTAAPAEYLWAEPAEEEDDDDQLNWNSWYHDSIYYNQPEPNHPLTEEEIDAAMELWQ